MQKMQETCVRSLGREVPLEEGMAAHSSVLAWEIPWTEEPGRLQSMGFQKKMDTTATEQAHTNLVLGVMFVLRMFAGTPVNSQQL